MKFSKSLHLAAIGSLLTFASTYSYSVDGLEKAQIRYIGDYTAVLEIPRKNNSQNNQGLQINLGGSGNFRIPLGNVPKIEYDTKSVSGRITLDVTYDGDKIRGRWTATNGLDAKTFIGQRSGDTCTLSDDDNSGAVSSFRCTPNEFVGKTVNGPKSPQRVTLNFVALAHEADKKRIESQELVRQQRERDDARVRAELEAAMQKARADAEASGRRDQGQFASAPTSPQPAKLQAAFANRRALVIGNDNYRNVTKLRNAGFDAKSLAQALESVGYQVTLKLDVDEKGMKQSWRDFKLQVQGGDEVVVFYSGHGVQLNAANYLLPVDIRADNEDQVKDDAISLQRVLDDLQEKRAKFSLVIVDACRNNPFEKSNKALGGRGLAPTTAATGQMVMFAAGGGQTALDRLNDADPVRNGLFTRVLVKEMVKPGVSVDRVLRNVRNEVVALAKGVGHEQTPALYDQAVGDFYFKVR